jgi:hypothetical protein
MHHQRNHAAVIALIASLWRRILNINDLIKIRHLAAPGARNDQNIELSPCGSIPQSRIEMGVGLFLV